MNHPISCGIDILQQKPGLLDTQLRYGLVTNDASVDRSGRTVKQSLLDAGFRLVRLYSPEHGFAVKGEDGIGQSDRLDEETKIPIVSLYGQQLKPNPEDAFELDALIFDLPNAGVRFYTYIWTMSYIMEWCAEHNVPLIILDRPNPLGGNLDVAEGPMMEPDFYSFIGRWNIPIRFSLTLGELAGLLKSEMQLTALSLQVIRVSGWYRNQTNKTYNYPFTPPSPALNSSDSLWTYPALCFFEATNISVGRGCSHSFQLVYAPWINGKELCGAFHDMQLPGVVAEFYEEIPDSGIYQNQRSEGIHLKVTDIDIYRPIFTGLTLLALLHTLYSGSFKWQPYPTYVNQTGQHHFELLTGTAAVKAWVEGQPLNDLDQLSLLMTAADWKGRVASSLLYV